MDVTTSDISREVADIIVDLNIIARIPTNHKLNTLTKKYVDADSLVYAFYRMITGETGEKTTDFINETLDKAIEICRKNPHWMTHIAEYVNSMSNSLVNLEQIYKRKNEESVVSKINLIRLRIDKERFLRACREISSSQHISIPTYIGKGLEHTGLTPIFGNLTAQTNNNTGQIK